MQTMDDALYDLFMRKVIDADTAVTYAQEPVSMNRKVNLDAGSSLIQALTEVFMPALMDRCFSL